MPRLVHTVRREDFLLQVNAKVVYNQLSCIHRSIQYYTAAAFNSTTGIAAAVTTDECYKCFSDFEVPVSFIIMSWLCIEYIIVLGSEVELYTAI